jgi:hypothetical protein
LLPNGRVLACGGIYSDGQLVQDIYGISSAEEYNPTTGTWSPTGNLTTIRARHTATLLANGQVLVAGGFDFTSPAELYIPGAASTPAALPTNLINARKLANGSFQFAFTNTPGAAFTVLATSFLSLPWPDWMVLSGVTETSAGQFQFTDPQTTNSVQRFYRLRSP